MTRSLRYVQSVLFAAIVLIISTATHQAQAADAALSGNIPVINVDRNLQAMHMEVGAAEYSQQITNGVTAFQDSAIPVLAQHDAQNAQSNTAPAWMLRTLVMGVGVNMEFGIGPVTVGANPKFRLVFSNSTDPVLP